VIVCRLGALTRSDDARLGPPRLLSRSTSTYVTNEPRTARASLPGHAIDLGATRDWSAVSRVAAIAAIALVLLVGQATAGPQRTLTLALQGGKTGPPGTSCGVHPRWAYYRVGGKVRYSGRLNGAPTGMKVHVTVKRCYPPTFGEVETQTARVRTDGTFVGSFLVHTRSDCFVQATYASRVSNRAYFRVR
jgi:hypothetical protein